MKIISRHSSAPIDGALDKIVDAMARDNKKIEGIRDGFYGNVKKSSNPEYF